MGREALGHTKEKRESLLKDCVRPESKLDGRQATAANQTCPADGPRRGGIIVVHRHKPVRWGLLCGAEQVRL